MQWSSLQEAIFDHVVQKPETNLVVVARAGVGKCLGKGTPVLLFDGSVRPVEQVQTGDLVMGPDSLPRRVLGLGRGVGPLFRITPTKGESWVCNDVHVLTLVGTNHAAGQVVDRALDAHLALCAAQGVTPDRNWKLWRTGVNFPAQTLAFPPYLLGLWLGDGTADDCAITNCEPEIQAYCQDFATTFGYELVLRPEPKNNTSHLRFKRRQDTTNPLRRFLRSCVDASGNKFIPQPYLTGDRDQRLSLLAGLLDTDGYLPGANSYEISTKSRQLAEGVLFLARSLGFAANCRAKVSTIKAKGFAGSYWRIFISGETAEIPCRVPRRRAEPRKQVKRTYVTGWRAEPVGDGEFYGFELDGDGRFLLGDFTVTHNTTTLLEAVNQVPEGLRSVICAFNSKIKEELERKCQSSSAAIKTLHGLGYASLMREFRGQCQVNKFRQRDFLKAMLPRNGVPNSTLSDVGKLVSMAMATLRMTAEDLDQLMDEFDCAPDYPGDRRRYIEWGLAVLEKSKVLDKTCSFDDQVWLPVVHGLKTGNFDYVFIDEAQDLNACQRELALKSVASDGKIVAVGDPQQAIYKWRGADEKSIDTLIEKLHADVLPLSITYRCPAKVVALVKPLVPDYEAGPGAPEGVLERKSETQFLKQVSKGDFVISRTNAAIAKYSMLLLRQGMPVRILGKDIAAGLISLIEKLPLGPSTKIGSFLEVLAVHVGAEVERLVASDHEEQADLLRDKAETLHCLAEGQETVQALKYRIERLFSEDDTSADVVMFSTVHRAKGLEFPRVYLLESTFSLRTDEGRNLYYVAATRSQRELYFVQTPKKDGTYPDYPIHEELTDKEEQEDDQHADDEDETR